MDFQLTSDQKTLQETARRYVRERLPDIARVCEETSHAPDRALVREFAEMGFLGVNVPQSCGGLGLGNLEALLVLEEFGKISSAVAFPVFESCVGPVRAIERFASESLRMRVVPAVCRGEIQVAVSMSEPQAGSALTDLTTRAELDGRRGRAERHQALVLGRRPRRRVRRLLPHVSRARRARHRRGLCREGHTGSELRAARAPDGISRRALLGHLLRQCRGTRRTTSSCRPAASAS